MDDYTLNHFAAWVMEHVSEDMRDEFVDHALACGLITQAQEGQAGP
jgi:hypothetical protein